MVVRAKRLAPRSLTLLIMLDRHPRGGLVSICMGRESPKDSINSDSSFPSGGVRSTAEHSLPRWQHMLTVLAKLELASMRQCVLSSGERRQLLNELFQYLEEMNDELPKADKGPPRSTRTT